MKLGFEPSATYWELGGPKDAESGLGAQAIDELAQREVRSSPARGSVVGSRRFSLYSSQRE